MNKSDIARVWFTPERIWVETSDGRRGYELYADYPRLNSATQKQRVSYEMSYFGFHWPELDEDLSYDGFFLVR